MNSEDFEKQKGKKGIDFDIENKRERELLGDHFYLHVGWNALKGKTKIKPWKDWKAEDFIEYHAKVVQALRNLGHEFKPRENNDLDLLSEKFLSKALVPSDIPTLLRPGIGAIQPETVVRQRRKKIKKTEKALVPSDIPTLIQPGATILRPAKILVEPHGEWAIMGKKKAFVSARAYEKNLNMPVYLVQGDQCLGLIEIKDPKEITLKEFKETRNLHQVSDEERRKWWPKAKKLYLYPIEVIQRFRPFRKIYRPKGAQTWLDAVTFLEDLPPLKFENVKDLNDEDLLEAHSLLHKYWAQDKKGYSREDLVNLHTLVADELRKRNMEHEIMDELDKETENFLSQLKKEGNLEIKFFGTKGLIEESSPDHKFHTAILLTFRNKKLLVDWGEINQGNLSEIQPDYILNSHAHPDHIGGLNDMEVYVSEDTEKVLPNLYKDFNITFHTFKSYETFVLEPFKITAIPVYHSVKAPMHVFLIQIGGTKILIATDVLGWRKGDREKYLKDLDLAIIDGSSLTRDLIRFKGDGEPFGHASLKTQLGQWYQPSNVKNIIITHLGKELVESTETELRKSISEITQIPFKVAKDNEVFQFETKALELEEALAPVYPSGIQLGRPIYLKEVLPLIRSFYPHRVFAWIVGGLANWGKTRGDIDILWRADPKMPNYFKKILEFRFGRQFLNPEIATRIQHHWDAFHGPFTNAIPIYALKVERINPSNVIIQASEEVVKPEIIQLEWDEKREGFIPPDFQYQLEKQRVKSEEIKREAEESKEKDEVKPFRYFLPLKPVRGYFPEERQSIETFLSLFKDEDFPVYGSKKMDGVAVEVHRVGDRVEIISEDGEHNEDRFVKTLEEAKTITDKSYVLMAECEIWENGKHQPREVAAGFLHSKGKPDDSKVVLNVFDLVYFDGKDIHNEPFEKRLEILEKEFKFRQSTDKVPNLEFKFNLIPHYLTKNKNELGRLTERLRRLPGSEGNVAKIHNFKYRLDGLRSGMIKFHNSSTVYAIVTKVKETKVKGVFNYFFGIRENKMEAKDLVQIGNTFYHQSGKTFSTSLKFQVGDKIEIECETFNLEKHPDGKYRVSLWAPRVMGKTDKPVDDIWTASKRAINNLSFVFKEVRKEGTRYFQNEIPTVEKAFLLEKFRDIKTYNPAEHTDAQLRDDLRLAMAYWSSLKTGKKMKFSKEDLIDFGKNLIRELLKRKKKNEGIYSAKPEGMKPNAREFWEKITEDLKEEEKDFLMKTDAYMVYPNEEKTLHYVIQKHFRGRSHHLDLRLEMNDYLIGWTITDQIKGEPKEPILTLEQAKRLDLNKISKIDWEKGVPKLRPGIKPGFKPKYAELSTARKSPEPKGWLYVEGVTPKGTVGGTREYPGVFLIVDKGVVEFGAQKPYFHEYFLSGGKLKGRWVFRQLRPAEFKGPRELTELIPPSKETPYREEAPFFLMKPLDETPYVISDKAMESNWVPPYGVSALPKKIKKQIPAKFQYWKIKDEKKRIETRNALIEAELKVELAEVSSAREYARALYRFVLAKIPYNTIWDPLPEEKKKEIVTNLVNQFLKEHPPRNQWIEDIENWLVSHEGDLYQRTLQAFQSHNFEKQGKVKFSLQWHYWRGQKVVRIGTPTTQHWDLRFDIPTPTGKFLHYVLDNNPLRTSETTALYKEYKYKEWMDFEGYLPPKNERAKMTETQLKKFPPGLEEANPTLDTPAFMELIDKGDAIVFEDSENFKKFQFKGQKLKGLWIFIREKNSVFWIMKKSEIPKPKT